MDTFTEQGIHHLKNVAQRSPRMILNKDKVQTRVGNIACSVSKK